MILTTRIKVIEINHCYAVLPKILQL